MELTSGRAVVARAYHFNAVHHFGHTVVSELLHLFDEELPLVALQAEVCIFIKNLT